MPSIILADGLNFVALERQQGSLVQVGKLVTGTQNVALTPSDSQIKEIANQREFNYPVLSSAETPDFWQCGK